MLEEEEEFGLSDMVKVVEVSFEAVLVADEMVVRLVTWSEKVKLKMR